MRDHFVLADGAYRNVRFMTHAQKCRYLGYRPRPRSPDAKPDATAPATNREETQS